MSSYPHLHLVARLPVTATARECMRYVRQNTAVRDCTRDVRRETYALAWAELQTCARIYRRLAA